MNTSDMLRILAAAFGPLDTQWEIASSHDDQGSFTIVRFDSTVKKGHLRRIHAMLEDMLSEDLSEGGRV